MQLCTATVRLGGLITNTVHLAETTPAEILVLQAIHGRDAVTDIIPFSVSRRTQNGEWLRLTKKYDEAQVVEDMGQNPESRLSQLFPGAVKRLPVTLAEAGLEGYVDPNRAPKHIVPGAPDLVFAEGDAAEPFEDAVGEALVEEAAGHEAEIAAALGAEGAPAKAKATA